MRGVGILFLLLFLPLFSCFSANSTNPKGKSLEITGLLYVMGNEPFTHLAIRSEGGEVFVIDDSQKEQYFSYQNKMVKIRGRMLKKKIDLHQVIVIENLLLLDNKNNQ